jgi:hypothetical protein
VESKEPPPEKGKESPPGLTMSQWVWGGGLATLIAVLAFLGVTNLGQLRHLLSGPGPTPAAITPAPQPTTPGPQLTTVPASFLVPSYGATAATFDPGSLNSSLTDATPFTEAALLPSSFTDNEDATFTRIASGQHQCDQAYSMGSPVEGVLQTNGCTTVMTGDYVLSGDVGYNAQILVSVQVFPLSDSAAAGTVMKSFPDAGNWDFGIWCPTSGLGSAACGSGYASAQKHEFLHQEYRYVIEATAIYVNQTQEDSIQPLLSSASLTGADDSGPDVYLRTH